MARKPKPNISQATDSNAPLIAGIGAFGCSATVIQELIAALDSSKDESQGLSIVLVQLSESVDNCSLLETQAIASKMKTVLVKRKAMLRPNTIYLTPPDKLVMVIGNRVHVSTNNGVLPANIISGFLHSLMEDQGPNSVGILLAGVNGEAKPGLDPIGETGGIVISREVNRVVELYTAAPLNPNQSLAELLQSKTHQITRFIFQNRMDEELRDEEARKSAILAASIDAIVTMDSVGRIVDFNPAAERTFGFSQGEVRGKLLADTIIPPQYREAHTKGLARFLKTGKSNVIGNRIELTALRADGSQFPIDLAINATSTRDGAPFFTAHMRDITEQKSFLQSIVDRDDRITALLNSTAEGIYGIDLDGNCTFANASCARLLGYSDPDELFGKQMHELIHHTKRQGEHYANADCKIYRAFRAGERIHVDDEVFWCADGSCMDVEYWSYPQNREGQTIGCVVTFLDISQRKQAEREIAQRQSGLQLALNAGRLGSWQWDVAEDRITWSEQLYELFGQSAEQFRHTKDGFLAIIHPDDRAVVQSQIDAVFTGNCREYEIEFRVIRADTQQIVWTYGRGAIDRDVTGQPIRITAVASDITERKLWEHELADREAHLRRVIDNTLGFIGVLALDGTLLEVNQTALAAGGLKRGEVVGRKFWECYWWDFNQDSVIQLKQSINRAIAGEVVRYDIEVRMAGDTRMWIDFQLSPVRNEQDTVTHLIPSGTDISARKKAERQAIQRESHLNLALESGKMGSWEWDIPANRITWSDRLHKMYGYSKSEFLGTPEGFLQIVFPDDREVVQKVIDSILNSNSEMEEFECRTLRGSDGQLIWTQVNGVVDRDRFAKALRITGVAVDITQRKRRELNLAFLAGLQSVFVQQLSADKIMQESCARIADHLNLSRCLLVEIDASATIANVFFEHSNPGLPTLLGSQFIAELHNAEERERFVSGQPVVIDDTQHPSRDPEQCRTLAALQVGSLVNATYFSNQRLKFVLSGVKTEAYRWRTDDIELMQELAARLCVRLERARAEETLRSREEQLRLGVEIAEFALAKIDYEKDTVHLSRESSRLYGFGDAETTHTRTEIHATFHPVDRPALNECIKRCLDPTGDGEFACEHRVVWPDGSVRWLKIRKRVFFNRVNDPPRPTHGILAVQDITERKHRELSLAFFAELQVEMASLTKSANIIRIASQRVAEFLDLSHCLLVAIDDEASIAEVFYDHCAPEQPSLCGIYQMADFMTKAERNQLTACQPIVISDTRHSSRSADSIANFMSLKIGAIVDAPGVYNQRLKFLLAAIKPDAYHWGNDEIELLCDLGNQIYLRIERSRAEEALLESEQTLRESEAHLRRVINNQLGLVGVIDRIGNLVEVDDRSMSIAGLTRDDVIGKHFAECPWWTYDPHVSRKIRDSMEKAFAGETVRYDVALYAKDNQRLMIDFMISPVHDDEGNIVYLIPSGVDISERKLAEEKLAESQQRLSMAMESARMGSYEWDPGTDDMKWDEQHLSITGLSKEKTKGADFFGLIHPDDIEANRVAIESTINGESDYEMEFRIIRPDGKVRWLAGRGRIVKAEGDRPLRFVGLNWDITDSKEQQNQISASEERLRLATSAAQLSLWEWDINADKIHWSDELHQRSGSSPGQPVGGLQDLLSLVHENDRSQVEQALQASVNNGQPYRAEFRMKRADGAFRWVLEMAHVTLDMHGKAIRMVGVDMDITDRKDDEIAIVQARAMAELANESKSEFLANMSHEIRTPMSAIIGYADILNRHLKDADNRNCVSIIRSNGQFLLEIINDILDISKIEAGKLELSKKRFRLDVLIADVQSLMGVRASEKMIDFDVEYLTVIPETIRSDAKRLKQILVNLIGNAIKFTDSGNVRLQITFNPEATPASLRFDIVDTGIGMSPEQMQKLFQPFTQADSSVARKYGGTGLGLTISQRLAEKLRGEISCESQLGKGSKFSLTMAIGSFKNIPLITPADWVPPLASQSKLPKVKTVVSGRILVVDDRREIRFIAQHFIEDAGGVVDTAENGQEAIDKVGEAAEQGMPFDMLIIDMQMPVIDGYEATRRLRASGFTKPIIALTAHAMEGDRQTCLAAGCTDYISKPLEGPKFIKLIAGYLRQVGKVNRGNRKILIVDDGVQGCEAIAMLLQLNGYQVEKAHCGETGIAIAMQFIPDVVLLDLGLPDISGFAVLKTLKRESDFANTKFVAMTGRANDDEVKGAGFDHHILKPLNVEDLEEWLKRVVDTW